MMRCNPPSGIGGGVPVSGGAGGGDRVEYDATIYLQELSDAAYV